SKRAHRLLAGIQRLERVQTQHLHKTGNACAEREHFRQNFVLSILNFEFSFGIFAKCLNDKSDGESGVLEQFCG
ncbi:MAG: hypothetical protein IKB18_07010, partial [Tidjanibacter sp.]|nr:hypothetical protein [Tidjanibacter sp.]